MAPVTIFSFNYCEKFNDFHNLLKVVIANILQTRRKTVVLVTPTDESAIWMSDQDLEMGKEIEEKIVNELTRRHVALTNGEKANAR